MNVKSFENKYDFVAQTCSVEISVEARMKSAPVILLLVIATFLANPRPSFSTPVFVEVPGYAKLVMGMAGKYINGFQN